MSLISIGRRKEFQFHQFRVGYIIKSEQIGTGFFDRRTISLQSIRVHSRKQFAGTVSKAFVQIRMKLVRQIGISINQFYFRVAVYKFFVESIAMSSFVISIGNISDSHGFRSVMRTNPVSIRKVDTNRCRRIKITGKDSGSDYFSRYTFHFIFLESFVHRRMVFKPLGITADNFRAVSRFDILEINQRFPTSFHAQRVAITFGKPVHKVNPRIKVLHPKNCILVKVLQVTRFIEPDQLADNRFLRLILSNSFRFLQPVDNLLNRLRIKSAYFPYLFLQLSILFHQTTVQAIRHRSLVLRVFHCIVEVFGFLLRHSVVVVAGGGQHKVFTVSLIHPLRHDSRVENHGEQFSAKLFGSLSV